MFKLENLALDIEIDLEPGKYAFNPVSASGKTYLYSVMADIAKIDSTIRVVSTDTYSKTMTIPSNTKLVIFDRFDTSPIDIQIYIPESCIALFDSKSNYRKETWYTLCDILYTEEGIRVWKV